MSHEMSSSDFARLSVDMGDLKSGQVRMVEVVEGLTLEVRSLTRTLRGSSDTDGLITKQRLLQARADETDKRLCQLESMIQRVWWGITVAAFSGLGAVAWLAITAALEH